MKNSIQFLILPAIFGLGLITAQPSLAAPCPGKSFMVSSVSINFINNSDREFLVRGTSWPLGAYPFVPGGNTPLKPGERADYSRSLSSETPMCVGHNEFVGWITDPNGTPIRLKALVPITVDDVGYITHSSAQQSGEYLPGYSYDIDVNDQEMSTTITVIIKGKKPS